MREQHYLTTLMTKRAGHTQILLNVLQEHLADMPNGEKLLADIAVQLAVSTKPIDNVLKAEYRQLLSIGSEHPAFDGTLSPDGKPIFTELDALCEME